MTHTYALMEVSAPTWNEIATKLREAGYDHAFDSSGALDMHGIGLVIAPKHLNQSPTLNRYCKSGICAAQDCRTAGRCLER